MSAKKSAKARAVQSAKDKARARWEFNLIKTGNIDAAYQSGNGLRSRGARAVGASKPRARGQRSGGMMIPNVTPTAERNADLQPGSMLRGQTIAEDEFITTISGNPSVTTTAFAVQPGLAGVYPWGSKVAILYEQYKIVKMEFYFRPLVSPFSAAGQQGKVVISCDYDAAEGGPATIQIAEAMDPHADGMPYENIVLTLDPRRATAAPKFTRAGFIPHTDVKTYDAGNVYVTVAGQVGTDVIGEIRVRYVLQLFNPRLQTVTVPPCMCISDYHFSGDDQSFTDNVPLVYGATDGRATWHGYTYPVEPGGTDRIGITLGLGGSLGEFRFPAGSFLMTASLTFLVSGTIGSCTLAVEYLSGGTWFSVTDPVTAVPFPARSPVDGFITVSTARFFDNTMSDPAAGVQGVRFRVFPRFSTGTFISKSNGVYLTFQMV
jgi:hypothetical protein